MARILVLDRTHADYDRYRLNTSRLRQPLQHRAEADARLPEGLWLPDAPSSV